MIKVVFTKCLPVFFFVLSAATAHGNSGDRYRFDMGTPESPLKEGYTRITPEDIYTSNKGYGWLEKPSSSFDRTKSRCKAQWYQKFWGEQVVGNQPYYGEPVDDLWRDGIAGKEDMIFSIDVPNGVYTIWATVGDEEWSRLGMNIAAEDAVVHEDIRTWIFWGAYPAHRRVMFRAVVHDSTLDIRFFNHGKDFPITMDTVETVHEVLNSVLAIEIELYHQPYLSLAHGKLSVDEKLDSPELRKAFKFYRQGNYDAAAKAWEAIKSDRADEIKGILYGWLAGNVTRKDELELLDKAVTSLELALRRFPDDMSIAQILQRTVEFRDGLLIFRCEKTKDFLDPNAWVYNKRYALSGKDILLQSTPDEPFYLKGRYEIARTTYWNLRESGGSDNKGLDKSQFVIETMKKILDVHPDFDMAKIYLNQKVPWGKDYSADSAGAPTWAALAREVLSRQHEVIHWWTEHQAPDGSMGGDQSFGDDVEMLRSWPGVALVTDDEDIRESMRRIADGVYTYIAPNGFNQGIWDVQHSAEPTGDPAFLTRIDYGNPKHVERGFRFMEHFRDTFTGINPKGHRHFKSILMGAEGVSEKEPFSCDTHYHVRAAKPGLWAMWYSGLPEAVDLFTEWADAWYEDAMRTDRGKPKGVMPSAVAFATDRIGGYGPENDWKITNSGYTYYDWTPGHTRLFDLLYVMWRMVGKVNYLEPMILVPQPSTVATWRAYTGDTSHDDIIKNAGGAYGRFLTSGDIGIIEKTLEGTLRSLRHNFPLKTSEVTMTDRISIGNTGVIHGMYTGAVPASNLPFTLGAVTWSDTGTDFAALVRENSPDGMRINVYGFYDSPREIGIRFWDLDRGSYEVRIGSDTDDDGRINGETNVISFTMDKRGDELRFTLPSRKLVALEVTQREAFPPVLNPLPDIAVVRDDIEFARDLPSAGHGTALSVMVHNIGGEKTGAFTVALSVIRGESRRIIDKVRFPGLGAPRDFKPKREAIALSGFVPEGAESIVVSVDPENEVDEIFEGNNEVVVGVE